MLEQYDVSALIDLNPKRSKQFIYNEMDINLDGVPVCPIGRKMLNWGVDKKRYRRKWRCLLPMVDGNVPILAQTRVMDGHFIHQPKITLGYFHV